MQHRGQQPNEESTKHSFSYALGRGGMKFFAKLLYIPGMRTLCKGSFLGACSYVKMLTQKAEYEQALSHLIKVLESKRFKTKRTYRWWYLMRQAVSILQDYELNDSNSKTNHIKHLIQLAHEGPEPKSGYDAAYSFVGMALWVFQMGNSQQAVSYVHQAIMADDSWGYPEYLMGWLGLFEPDIDPIPHFVNALQFNWSFFHRMNKDPICQQHPQMIRQVRQRVLMMTNTNSPSKEQPNRLF